ncbi:MAG: hypothetical protein M1832_002813 [Thelocarpon impressellum]|nr:MAG: hypothetical protein M1832_002813 [Thelocarpon impressellum]
MAFTSSLGCYRLHAGLRAVSILSAVTGITALLWASKSLPPSELSTSYTGYGMVDVALAAVPLVFTLAWSGSEMFSMLLCGHVNHPAANLAADLFSVIPCALLWPSLYFRQQHFDATAKHMAKGTFGPDAAQMVGPVRRLDQALLVGLTTLLITFAAHFCLFVLACRDTHRLRMSATATRGVAKSIDD